MAEKQKEELVKEIKLLKERISLLEAADNERERAEESLRESEEKYKRLVETTCTGYVILDEQGKVADANAEYVRMTGRKNLDEIKGRSVLEWTAPHDLERNRHDVKKCLEQGNIHNLEMDYITPGGKTVPIEINAKVLLSGIDVRILTLCRDITERKRAEAALKESEEKFRSIFEISTVGKSLTGADGRILRANSALAEMLGYTVEELTRLNFAGITHPGDIEKTSENIRRLFMNELQTLSFEKRFIHKNGNTVYVNISSVLQRDGQGQPLFIISSVIDITQQRKSETALQEAHDRLKSFVDSNIVGILVATSSGKVVEANDYYLRLIGYTRAEFNRGMVNWRAITPPEWLPAVDRAMGELREKGISRPYEKEYLRKDGTRVFVLISDAILPGPEEQIAAFVLDIGERKRIENILKLSEEKYRKAFSTSPDSININRLEDGMYVSINSGFTRTTGYTEEDCLGKTSLELSIWADPKDRERLTTGLKKYGFVENLEAQFRTKNGNIIYGLMSASIIELDGVPHLLNITRDITDRRLAEKEITESEAKLRLTVDEAPIGVVMVGLDNRFLSCNKACCAFIGYSEEELKQKTFLDITFPQDREIGLAEIKDILAGKKKGVPLRKRYVRKDGSIVWGELNIGLVRDKEGRPVHFLSMLQDITERKRMEEELNRKQKLDSLGILAGGIAHDFNNILTGIIGNISLARCSTGSGEENLAILEDTEKAALRAKNLTLQLLTFAKGGAPVKKITALPAIIKEAVAFATHGSNAVCRYHISPDVFPVDADPGQLGQVVSNIVINAVQAMPDGGEISITAENIPLPEHSLVPLETGSYVRVVIKDKGVGIKPEILGKIFDPYFTTKDTGSGLGLATCYSIIKNHGGHISVESEPGRGASFTIHLKAAEGKAVASVQSGVKELKKGAGRILILDDEELICVLGTRILTKLGYKVEAFAESDAAVARYRHTWGTKEAFDAVILDLTIPGYDNGVEVLAKLKKINPGIKAVVSSGYSADPVIAMYREHGFSAVLQKPYSASEAGDVLSDLLSHNK